MLLFLLISLLPVVFTLISNAIGSIIDLHTITLSFVMPFLLPCYIFMIATELFVSEIETGTIKLALTRPIARWKIYTSKIIVASIVIFALLLTIWFMSFLMNLFGYNTWSAKGLIEELVIYVVTFFPMFVLFMLSVWIGQMVHSITGSMVISLLLYALFKVVPIFIPLLGNFLFTNYMDWYTLWVNNPLPWSQLFSIASMFLASGAIFGVVGLFLFEQKEIN